MVRESTHLGRKATTAIKQSFRTAAAINRPLNTYVTINVMQTEAPEEETSARFLKLRERRFGRWASYIPKSTRRPRNGPPTDVWVIEAPNGHAHIHWVLHIDPVHQEEFEKKLVRWVDAEFKIGTWAEHAVDIRPVQANTASTLGAYLAKGTDPNLAAFYYIPDRFLSPQGVVYGKRSGVSLNLATAARTRLKNEGAIRRHKYQPPQKFPQHRASSRWVSQEMSGPNTGTTDTVAQQVR